MIKERINEIWNKTKELDPDYVVEVLQLTTEEVMVAFRERMLEFIEDEYEDYIYADEFDGFEDYEEGDYDGPDFEEES